MVVAAAAACVCEGGRRRGGGGSAPRVVDIGRIPSRVDGVLVDASFSFRDVHADVLSHKLISACDLM